MNVRWSAVLGILFILIGLKILLDDYVYFDFYFFRSYGLIIFGLLGLFLASARKLYFPFLLLTLTGLYFLLAEWGLYDTGRGTTVSVITMLIGLALISSFLVRRGGWLSLAFGAMILSIGIFFLVNSIGLIPYYTFRTLVNDYWPVVVIVSGTFFLVHAMLPPRSESRVDASASE